MFVVIFFLIELLMTECMLHTITGLALETFIAPVGLLNALYEKSGKFKSCNWDIDK